MVTIMLTTARVEGRNRSWKPAVSSPHAVPIPREHGAWVMLGAPLLIVLAAAPPSAPLPALLLLIAAASAFCLQHLVGVALLRRRVRESMSWLVVYLSLLVTSSLALLFAYRLTDLIPLGLLAAGMFGQKAVLSLSPRRRWNTPRDAKTASRGGPRSDQRFDRSLWGELMGTMALTLTGPAACVVSRGALDGVAWLLWALFIAYYTGGVLFVNMLIDASRSRDVPDVRMQWRLGRAQLLYHAALAVAVVAVAAWVGGPAAILLPGAYAPIVARAFTGWYGLAGPPPSLKQVG
jgi:hypothetical protein